MYRFIELSLIYIDDIAVFYILIYKKVETSGIIFFFFFKQKTAYENRLSLVGSEMCIRDRTTGVSTRWRVCR